MSAKSGMQKVEGWVPTHDLAGNRITNANLGPGGVRNTDGTLASLVSNPRILEDRHPGDRSPVVSPRSSPIADAIVIAAVDAAVKVTIDIATPIVEQWWAEIGAPAAAKKWNSLRSRMTRKSLTDTAVQTDVVEFFEVKRSELDAASTELKEAVHSEVVTLSREEASKLYVEMMIALGLAAERMRTLRSARVEAPIDFEALEQAARELTTPEAIAEANLQLESAAENLQPNVINQFVELYGGGTVIDEVYVRIQEEQVRKVLRLPEEPSEDE